jgi:hypothetical protein
MATDNNNKFNAKTALFGKTPRFANGQQFHIVGFTSYLFGKNEKTMYAFVTDLKGEDGEPITICTIQLVRGYDTKDENGNFKKVSPDGTFAKAFVDYCNANFANMQTAEALEASMKAFVENNKTKPVTARLVQYQNTYGKIGIFTEFDI